MAQQGLKGVEERNFRGEEPLAITRPLVGRQDGEKGITDRNDPVSLRLGLPEVTVDGLGPDPKHPAWTIRVVANGKLYLRYRQRLVCYSLLP